jgi:hypothetical protein
VLKLETVPKGIVRQHLMPFRRSAKATDTLEHG